MDQLGAEEGWNVGISTSTEGQLANTKVINSSRKGNIYGYEHWFHQYFKLH